MQDLNFHPVSDDGGITIREWMATQILVALLPLYMSSFTRTTKDATNEAVAIASKLIDSLNGKL